MQYSVVDDDEAEALEGHLVSEKLVRADHDVDRAVGDAFGQAGAGLALLGGVIVLSGVALLGKKPQES